ncbi:pilus assembly protein [Achromobacter deleyi]|uniref:Pilus assembly protein n=1 Tax=Achromobacter deleyi TaxID=1353891 RepID=A0A7T4E4B0_9BURK|nr:TadE/TadG family type IV pilus assembly protein [Achromobacter deleyi]QQB34969.1 pilus assembly protein [Achromobacter deleyi]
MTAFFVASRSGAARPLQRGAAALEFTLVAVLVLLLALGTVEAVRWQLTRQVAHLALLQAARAGATAHADPARIRAAFQQALLPLHAGSGGDAGARRRQASAQTRIAARVGASPWRIEILRPDAQAFRDHARPGLRTDAPGGLPAIDNAYQALQYARRPDLPDSRSIFLANTLRLRLTYLYRPLLPPLRTLLAALARADGSYAAAAWANGLVPIGMELELEMHSHPVDWRGGQPYPAGMVAGACRSLHCP